MTEFVVSFRFLRYNLTDQRNVRDLSYELQIKFNIQEKFNIADRWDY